MRKIKNKIFSLLAAATLLTTSIFGGSANVFADMAEGSADIAYQIGSEGVVLVKNDNSVLPLSNTETVSVFGRTQVNTIRGGTGSGNVSVSYVVSILEGIRNSGIAINEDLAAKYEAWCEENPVGDGASGSLGDMSADPCNPEMPITADEINAAAENSNIAVIVIGRNTGESGDHEAIAGDYYLSEEEEELVENVTAAFDEVVAVMNVGTIMDMKWVDDYGVEAALFGWQGGNETGNIIADVLSGKTNPSGKLVDTIAYTYDDYPSAGNFSNAPRGSSDYVEEVYAEDIFVGYRYFETFAPEKVQYEFGYGLSYTAFEQEITEFSASGSEIKVSVQVTNTGDVAGKEVVQVYFSAPRGKLGKPAKELAAYGKTDELAPGESQILTLTYRTEDMSSYDDSGVTGHKSAYVMESGVYAVYAGNSVKNVAPAGSYTLNGLLVTEQLTEQMAVETDSAFPRLVAGNTYEVVPTRTVALEDIEYDIPEEITYIGDQGYGLIDVYNGDCTMEQFVAQLDKEELIYLTQGRGMDLPGWGYTVLTDNTDGKAVAGAAGGFGYMEKYGIPIVTTADGPAGIRVDKEVNGPFTHFPMGTMVACTWNEDLMEAEGVAVGTEAADVGVDVWLAPGMNIHRDPLGGRNFEYYSEDPLVTGVTAAAVTRGVQSKGIGVTLKHFAVNSAEDARQQSNSIISERALREIYLKGFEITVKTADPWYIMSSYNLINGSYAASNYELLTNILRKEWGFDATVMTDWLGKRDDGDASMIRAQNDLCMPGSMFGQSDLNLVADVDAGKVTVAETQRSAINILNSAIKSLQFSEDYDVTDNLTYEPSANWFNVAKSNIFVISVEDPDPSVPSDSSVPSSSSDDSSTANVTLSPKTGDYSAFILIAALLGLSCVVVILSKRKNK